MASYGSGFAQGMSAGSAMAGNMLSLADGLSKKEERETLFNQNQSDRTQKGELMKAYYSQGGGNNTHQTQEDVSIAEEGQALFQEGQQQQQIAQQFDAASPADMTHFIMEKYKANGGKINDQTYSLANGIATELFNVKQEAIQYQNKTALFKDKLKTNALQRENYQHNINTPYSNEGKLFKDMNQDLNMKNLGTYYETKRDSKTLTPKIRNYQFAKKNGYEGSFEDFQKLSKTKSNTTSTKLSKLINERNNYKEGSKEYKVYTNAIKLASEGKESEIDKFMRIQLGDENAEAPKKEVEKNKQTTVDDLFKKHNL